MPQWEKVVGKHPVLEAIRAGRGVGEILVADGADEAARDILEAARAEGIPVRRVPRKKLDQEASAETHQGVLAFVKAREYAEVDQLFDVASKRGEEPLLVAIDGVEDPRNLGAVLRVAYQAGAHGAILSSKSTASLTPAAAKASAGASEHLLVAKPPNLANTLLQIQRKQRAWVVGIDGTEGQVYHASRLTGPLVLVVGSEDSGLTALIRQRVDGFVRVPVHAGAPGLNVAVAAGVVLFERARQAAAAALPT